jgi:hypothetical protein
LVQGFADFEIKIMDGGVDSMHSFFKGVLICPNLGVWLVMSRDYQ